MWRENKRDGDGMIETKLRVRGYVGDFKFMALES